MHPTSALRLSVTLAFASITALVLSSHGVAADSTTAANGTAAAASSAGSASTPPAANVTVTFKTYGFHGNSTTLYYKSGSQLMPASATADSLSAATYNYSGSATMELQSPDTSARGTASAGGTGRRGARGAPTGPMKTVASVTFPKSGTYIIYMNSTDAFAMSTSAAQFPMGSLRVVNTTKYPMQIRIADAFVPLKVGDSMQIPFKGTDQFPLIVQRADVDPPTGVTQGMVAKPSPGLRTTKFIYVGNSQQVKTGAEPNFNTEDINDSGATATSPASGTGRAPRNGTGRGTGNGGGG